MKAVPTATGWTGAVEKQSAMQRHTDGHQSARGRARTSCYLLDPCRPPRLSRDSRASRKFFLFPPPEQSQPGSKGLRVRAQGLRPTRCPGALSLWAKPSHRRNFGRSKGRSLAWVAHVTSQAGQYGPSLPRGCTISRPAPKQPILFKAADLTIFQSRPALDPSCTYTNMHETATAVGTGKCRYGIGLNETESSMHTTHASA